MASPMLSEADLAYIRANFATLEQISRDRPETPAQLQALIDERRLPQPSYVLEDGTGMFPADYLRLADEAGGVDALQAAFAERHRAASLAEWLDPRYLDVHWDGYLRGVYGACLREVSPESIVRKNALVTSVCELLVLARPANEEWAKELREHVDELDALEREFSPDYDRRHRFGRATTRDLLVVAARERFPEVFALAELA